MNFRWSSVIEVDPKKTLPTLVELETFEATLGVSLPEDYRKFLLEFNGGKVLFENDIPVPELDGYVFVHYLWSLKSGPQSYGIVDARNSQLLTKCPPWQAISIGDDEANGTFYLMFSGKKRGSVYYAYNEDRELRYELIKFDSEEKIPNYFIKVCPTFNDLGKIILRYKVENRWDYSDEDEGN